MSFFNAVKVGFKKYFSVEGRASRRDFWYWFGFCCLVLFIATLIDGIVIGPALGFLPFEQDAGRPLALACSLGLLLPTITAAVRRLHDSDYVGWWLLGVFTIVGALPLAYLLIKGGSKKQNRFDATA